MSYPTIEDALRALRALEMYPFGYDFNRYKTPRAHWCSEDGHEPVENGAQRSWCKHCDVNMIFEWKLNKYIVLQSQPEEKKGKEL